MEFTKKPNMLYAILAYDPDAPAQPSWLHWAKINISSTNPGTTLMSYSPPTPPSGTHRYIYALYKQKNPINFQTLQRPNFDYKKFIEANKLQMVSKKIYKVVAKPQ